MHIMFSGGGTGGHIFPSVAVANEIKLRFKEVSISFVGAENGMEMEKVPQSGYTIEGLPISGIQRRKWWKNLSLPFKVWRSLYKSKKLLKKYTPSVVVGTGGYASGPLLYAAAKKGIPTLTLEANAYPGITNKWLKNKVNKICLGSQAAQPFFPQEKCVYTGNPIRQNIDGHQKTEGCEAFKFLTEPKTLLIIGGSLGAGSINKAIAKHLQLLVEQQVQVIWQTGKYYYSTYQDFNKVYPDAVRVVPFIQNMNHAYSAADVIISRAGAISLAELAIVQKACILVPSPNVAENHQYKNAKELADKNAAVLVPDAEAENDLVNEAINLLFHDIQCQTLADNIAQFAKPNATHDITHQVLMLAGLEK